VTVFTLAPKSFFVNIILGVASLRRAVLRCVGKLFLGMARSALGNPIMQTEQWPVRVIGMIKANGRPDPRLVTSRAVVTKRAKMQRIIVAIHSALLGNVVKRIVGMTFNTRYVAMALH